MQSRHSVMRKIVVELADELEVAGPSSAAGIPELFSTRRVLAEYLEKSEKRRG